MDLRLKLSSFILKNQPKKGKKDKASKKARRAKDKENGDAEENVNGNGHNGSPRDSTSDNADGENGDVDVEAGSDDELTRRITAEAKELDRPADLNDDEWAVDVSEEAVKARAKELPDDLKRALVVEDGDEDGEGEGTGNNVYDQLGSWIISAAEDKSEGVAGLADVDIYVKARELGIETKHKTLAILAQTIFDDNIVKQIPKRGLMLKKVSKPKSWDGGFALTVTDGHFRSP